jgi:hypothetical protein
MDPFQSLLQGVQPALGAMQPIFDIINFAMKLLQCLMLQAKIFGALLMPLAPGNMFSMMFKIDPMRDGDGNAIEPYIPDIPGIAPALINCMLGLLGGAMKLAGLVPQISVAVTIKDSVITAMGFADAAMSQFNSLADLFTGLPPPTTGNALFDLVRQCAGDNSVKQLEHKIGPLASLATLMGVVSMLAQVAKQPLPSVIYDMAKILGDAPPAGFGMLPFPDLSAVGGPTSDEQRQQFLGLIEEMTVSGLPIDIPDFSDLSNLGTLLDDLRQKMAPILPVIEMLQSVFDKLSKA